MLTDEDRRLLARAILVFGADKQWDMVLEECTELELAILHERRNRATVDQVAEEVADAMIVIEQARLMIGSNRVDRIVRRKVERLRSRVVKAEVQAEEKRDEPTPPPNNVCRDCGGKLLGDKPKRCSECGLLH